MLPQQLPVNTGAIALCDPGTPKTWRVLDRPSGAGAFRVMLSLARDDDRERLAAVIVHIGRPPIAHWTVAHHRGTKPPTSSASLPRCPVTTGWLALLDAGNAAPGGALAVPVTSGITAIDIPLVDGRHALALPCGNGEFAAYWGIDPSGKPVCLVVDFDVFTQKEWRAKPA